MRPSRRSFLLPALALVGLFAAGCRQDMHDQLKYEPYEATSLLPDGTTALRPVANTVARGSLVTDLPFATGRDAAGEYLQGYPLAALRENWPEAVPESDTEFARAVLERGGQRFEMFCTPCHGRTGAGNGMIVQRGFQQPTSFHDPRLVSSPPGYFFTVMTEGFGAMASYAPQVRTPDRWAIAAYIQALQLSQSARFSELTPEVRQRAEAAARGEAPADDAGHGDDHGGGH